MGERKWIRESNLVGRPICVSPLEYIGIPSGQRSLCLKMCNKDTHFTVS